MEALNGITSTTNRLSTTWLKWLKICFKWDTMWDSLFHGKKTHLKSKKTYTRGTQWHSHHYQQSKHTLLSKSDSKSNSNESKCVSFHFIEKTHLKSKKTTTKSTQWHYHHSTIFKKWLKIWSKWVTMWVSLIIEKTQLKSKEKTTTGST